MVASFCAEKCESFALSSCGSVINTLLLFILNFQTLTNAFKQHDHNLDGWIKVGYEQFLTMVFSCKKK